MEVITCKSCGKIFNYIQGDRICPLCMKKMDDKFAEVKKYVYKHPRVDMNELATEMEVSIRQIKKWIREERLSFTEDSPIGLECECCGAVIKTGRYCKPCKDQLANGLKDAAGLNRKRQQEKAARRLGSAESKMRFLDQ